MREHAKWFLIKTNRSERVEFYDLTNAANMIVSQSNEIESLRSRICGMCDGEKESEVGKVIAKYDSWKDELVSALSNKDIVCYKSDNGDTLDSQITAEEAAHIIEEEKFYQREGRYCVRLRTQEEAKEYEIWKNDFMIKRCEEQIAYYRKRNEEMKGAK